MSGKIGAEAVAPVPVVAVGQAGRRRCRLHGEVGSAGLMETLGVGVTGRDGARHGLGGGRGGAAGVGAAGALASQWGRREGRDVGLAFRAGSAPAWRSAPVVAVELTAGPGRAARGWAGGPGWPGGAHSPPMPGAACLGSHGGPVLSSSHLPLSQEARGGVGGAGDPGSRRCAGQVGVPASTEGGGEGASGTGGRGTQGCHAFNGLPELQDPWSWWTPASAP